MEQGKMIESSDLQAKVFL